MLYIILTLYIHVVGYSVSIPTMYTVGYISPIL